MPSAVAAAGTASGHYLSHVAYYDRQTGLFFSGDFLLPGRLLIEDTNADLARARRAAEFVEQRPVTYVLTRISNWTSPVKFFWVRDIILTSARFN
jgi:hypothetical protein